MYPQEFLIQNPLTQMSVSAPPGRTHLYYTGTPEFGFGSGLSYSTWGMHLAQAAAELSSAPGAAAGFSVTLTNHGPLDGRQRVMAFARPKSVEGRDRRGLYQQRLWGYAGAELRVGESQALSFSLSASDLAQSDAAGNRVLLPGLYEIAFSDGASEVKAGSLLRVTGEPTIVEASAFRQAATPVAAAA